MARKGSSRRWLREHHEDPWVERARKEGWRSRAVYKLAELDRRDQLIQPGSCVVDLGAAPGGWTQYAVDRVGSKGRVFALDRLEMPPVPGAAFILGDFTEQEPLDELLARLEGRPVDLVLSDMAPNISGVKAVDQPAAMYLAELALDFAGRVLSPGGSLLVKTFQGEGFDAFLSDLRGQFGSVRTRKPEASRGRSPEVYLLARNYRMV